MTIRTDIKTSLIIFIGFLLFFIFIPNNDQGYDSISYSIAVRDGGDLFHPHHLLYHLFGFLISNLFSFTGLGSMKILSLVNSLLGAVTLTLIYRIIKIRADKYIAIIGTLMIGGLFSFWYYATSVEVNMPALMFVCLALYYLIGKPLNRLNSTMVYVLFSSGILFHQIAVIAVIPIFIYDMSKNKSFAKTLTYAWPGLLSGFLIYLIIAFSQADDKNFIGIYKWLTFYGHLDAWGTLRTANIIGAGWGILKTFFGGDLIRQYFYTDTYSALTVLYGGAVTVIGVSFAWLVKSAVARLISTPDDISYLLLSLTGIFGLFALWWAPADDGFWLYPVVILLIFIFRLIEFKRSLIWISSAMAALLICVNLACEFIPASNKNNSFIYQGVKAFERLGLTENDLVITNFSQIRLAYEYYNEIRVPTACLMYLEPGPKDDALTSYQNRITQAAKSGRVIMFEDEIDPEPSRNYLFNRFSLEDYRSTYEIYFDNLTPVDSIMIHGRNVKLYELETVN